MNINRDHIEDSIQIIEELRFEVQALRQANNELAQRAEAYETIVAVLGVRPKASRTMREDPLSRAERVSGRLQKHIASQPKPLKPDEPPEPA